METILDLLFRSPGAIVFDMAWKSAMVLVAAGAITLAMRRASAAARHLVWCLALCGTVVLPGMALIVPGWPWPVLPARQEFALSATSAMAAVPTPTSSVIDTPFINTPRPDMAKSLAEPLPAAPRSVHFTPEPPLPTAVNSPWACLLGTWLAVAFAILAAPLIGRSGLRRLALRARPIRDGDWASLLRELTTHLNLARRVTMLRSHRATMPMTWGSLRPVVLLPASADDWPSARRRDVLLHELAHVQRFDCLTQAVAQVACALYWFNPLAWLAARRMRIERERACDDIVLRAGSLASDYAGHLLEIARGLRVNHVAALAAVAMARPSQLEGRLLAILDPNRRRGGLGRTTVALVLLSLLGVLVPLATVRLSARAASATETTPMNSALDDHQRNEADARMIVTGRVLDPAGKPMAGVPVEVVGRPRAPEVGTVEKTDPYVLLGRGATDADGRFRLDASRSSTARYIDVHALAAAPGFGFGWISLNPDAEQPAADFRLHTEQVIQGRLVDVSGQPAAGVEIQVHDLGRSTGNGNDDSIGPPPWWFDPPEGLRAWPKLVTTDGQGRFTLAGIGRDFSVSLYVHDIRFARQRLELKTDDRQGPKDVALALQPATIIEGRVLAADTSQPIPHAVISIAASYGMFGGMFTTKYQADAQGRFTANPSPGDYFRMSAFAPDGQYLARRDEFAWTKGAVKKEIEIKLPRGVVIRGKVTEQGTGRPLAGVNVHYFPRNSLEGILNGLEASVASKDDGSFAVAVLPGKGYLLVLAPTLDYLLEEIGSRTLYEKGQPGGMRHYAHDIIAYDVNAHDSPEISAVLRPGKTVRGRVVGPEGQSVKDAAIITRLVVDPRNLIWSGSGIHVLDVHARDGRFELHGLDPEKSEPVYFLDADHQYGTVVELSGKQAGEEVMVRLLPCGQAKARFVKPDGKPIGKLSTFPFFELLAKPGRHDRSRDRAVQAQLAADSAFMANVDRKHYSSGPRGPVTDSEGRITLPALIPGALYRISDFSTGNDADKGVQVRKDFTVKPGETVDLGDILIEKPQP